MAVPNDALTAALGQLERVLAEASAGHEQEWTGKVDQALTALERAVRQRAAALRPLDSRVVDVDRPRLPSPTVDRRAAALQEELENFVEETRTLRMQAEGARPALSSLGTFRARVRELDLAVRRHENAEAELILESVNTDIGAGD